MMYIIEAIAPTENIVTLYYRSNIDDACRWADFLKHFPFIDILFQESKVLNVQHILYVFLQFAKAFF